MFDIFPEMHFVVDNDIIVEPKKFDKNVGPKINVDWCCFSPRTWYDGVVNVHRQHRIVWGVLNDQTDQTDRQTCHRRGHRVFDGRIIRQPNARHVATNGGHRCGQPVHPAVGIYDGIGYRGFPKYDHADERIRPPYRRIFVNGIRP